MFDIRIGIIKITKLLNIEPSSILTDVFFLSTIISPFFFCVILTQINVYNLADKEYVANVNKNGNRYTPGSARSGLLSLAYKF